MGVRVGVVSESRARRSHTADTTACLPPYDDAVEQPPISLESELSRFDGRVRLFPLPDFVLFPDGLAPLNVFEERYLRLVRDALEDDNRIGLAFVQPGYEGPLGPPAEGERRPPVPLSPVVTVGKIVKHAQHPNGTVQILLYGLFRGRILSELKHEPYRIAQVAIERDLAEPLYAEDIARSMQRALELLPGKRSLIHEMRQIARTLRGMDGSAGRYADAAANVSDLTSQARYEVMAEQDVRLRFERLIHHLEEHAYQKQPAVHPRTHPKMN